MIQFIVHGLPKPQPRHRAFRRGNHAAVYDPGTAAGWKALVAHAADPYRPDAPMDGPLRVDLTFLFPRPKRLLRKRDSDQRIPHDKKPDRDNLEKAVLDTLTQLGFWRDDCQVCAGEVKKAYVAKENDTPGVEITIAPVQR